jgi:hypothetical protein
MFGVEVRTIPCGFGASTNAQSLYSVPSNDLGFQPTCKMRMSMCGCNDMMMDPYPHPQHMMDVKHLVYVWGGSENHSMWIWSLNQYTLASFGTKQ